MKSYIIVAMMLLCGTVHAYHLKSKTVSENGTAPRYSVMAQYPVIKGLHGKDAEAALNEHIAKWILERTTQFRQEMTSIASDDVGNLPGNNRISITYVIKIKTDHVLGLSWDVYQEYIGSAHPSEVLLPMMYNLDTGAQITLADLFKPGSSYLKRLSQICTQQLMASFAGSGYPVFEDGLKPTPQNFANFLIRPEGLYFLFNPYQVAPYVAGAQEVVIPYPLVADILQPGGPVAEIRSQGASNRE